MPLKLLKTILITINLTIMCMTVDNNNVIAGARIDIGNGNCRDAYWQLGGSVASLTAAPRQEARRR
jgi:hypothetical protein